LRGDDHFFGGFAAADDSIILAAKPSVKPPGQSEGLAYIDAGGYPSTISKIATITSNINYSISKYISRILANLLDGGAGNIIVNHRNDA
jgi:hypothetical protein